jgi:hypothetical protein
MTKSTNAGASKPTGKVQLIVSDEERPIVALTAGNKFHVTTVSIVTPELKRAKPIAARLCGGSNTCLALIEL